MLYDHVDLRVKDLEAARSFYGAWLPALGLVELEGGEGSATYGSSAGGDVPFLSVTEDRQQRPDRTRLAFRARTRAELDEAARLVRVAALSRVRSELLRGLLCRSVREPA